MADVRLIDANALRKNLSSRYMNELYPDWLTLPELTKMRIEMLAKEFRFALDHAITINATPVEYAQWEKPHGMMPPEYHHRKCCSICGGWALYDRIGKEWESKYCPHCGAKMDGGADDV